LYSIKEETIKLSGCTSYGYFGRMDGSMSNLTTCFAQNDGTDCKYGITNIKDEVYTNIKCRLNKVYIY